MRRQQDFAEGDLLFKEPPLVAGQHVFNRSKAVVCANCFRFLGSVELQIAWHLLCDKYEGAFNSLQWQSSFTMPGCSVDNGFRVGIQGIPLVPTSMLCLMFEHLAGQICLFWIHG